MTQHVILGTGPIGTTTARLLLADGEQVLVLSRSGRPSTPLPGAEYRAVDASDGDALTTACSGATVIYNCANPAYHRWATDWPPIHRALLRSARTHEAVLVTAANLYGYGPVTGPMTEESPLAATETKGRVRADMWREAEAEHRAGRVRTTEIRASDYLGPLALDSAHAGTRLLAPLLAGKPVRPIGNPDRPHSWTYLPDLARALVAAGRTEAAWGSAWHAPTPEPRSFRQLATGFAEAAGAPAPRVRPLPLWMVGALGTVNPMLRELHRIGYQFADPFVLESTTSARVLGVDPTPWDEIIATTLDWWRTTQPA